MATVEEALGSANVLGSRTLDAKGQILLDQRITSREGLRGVPSEVDARLSELLQQAQAAAGSAKRVLFQHLQVEEVPVCEVVYEYRRPPERRLWIYGQQRCVYAPGAETLGKDCIGVRWTASCCCRSGVGGVGVASRELSTESRRELITVDRRTKPLLRTLGGILVLQAHRHPAPQRRRASAFERSQAWRC